MGPEAKHWNNLLVSLGLTSTDKFTAIALGAANIDPVDMLGGDGVWDNVRYLRRAFIEGIGMKTYFKKMNELQDKAILSTNDDETEQL